jgi:hypothetical protein
VQVLFPFEKIFWSLCIEVEEKRREEKRKEETRRDEKRRDETTQRKTNDAIEL